MSAVLQEIGFTKEELQERVIERICDRLLTRAASDEEGAHWVDDSEFKRKLDEQIKGRINATINEIAEKHVLPNVASYIESLTLVETNKWGEAKGKGVTFIEYLVERAQAYMTEQVDYDGKARGDRDSYNWRAHQTRITHLIHEHLHYQISTAMGEALKTANGAIAGGIQAAIKIKLDEIVNGLQVAVAVKK